MLIINLLAYYYPILFKNPLLFHSYVTVAWLIISFRTKFYGIYANTKITYILKLSVRQFLFFFLIIYAFIGFFKQPNISRWNLGLFFVTACGCIFFFKAVSYFVLMEYRRREKFDLTKFVVIGNNKKTDELIKIFRLNQQYGFQLTKQFFPKDSDFSVDECCDYIKNKNITEIFCSINQLANEQIKHLVSFADNNLVKLRFIPDNKQIFTKFLKLEYYEYFPILSLRESPLDNTFNRIYKRVFDFFFALVVFVFLLSWLMPIIGLLIKMDSKGPVYFKQNRPGFQEEGFGCYKFRTMRVNDSTEKSAIKNDPRVTRVGAFLRRTSIDELPQFVNVLLGTMSVVGPRPHLWRQNEEYNNKIQKYMLRHHVKPGITGLAQAKGYRGEILANEEIVNRTRYDVFYIENWSMLLDMKIIIQTVLNVIKGEDKAY
ncbi:Glycosyltransferase [Croceitalea dokdonensis DOKDO 023]|uniref:Glycosyltransferase n=1 Tax=Croceitalea dokdonensis DOKDO 023 TaxID=1300341 RepID=A0A0P7ASW9_9FLAO|nr:Glycosyltransferase [Croceitalea dokdonensis DOKDO 023]